MNQDSDVLQKLLQSLSNEDLEKLGTGNLPPEARALFEAETRYRGDPSLARPKAEVVYLSGTRQLPFVLRLMPQRAWQGTESLWRVFWLMTVPVWFVSGLAAPALLGEDMRSMVRSLLAQSLIGGTVFAPLMIMIWRCRNNLTADNSWAKTSALLLMGFLAYQFVIGGLVSAALLAFGAK